MNQKGKEKYKIFSFGWNNEIFPRERCERVSELVCVRVSVKAVSRLIWFDSVRIISANMFFLARAGDEIRYQNVRV